MIECIQVVKTLELSIKTGSIPTIHHWRKLLSALVTLMGLWVSPPYLERYIILQSVLLRVIAPASGVSLSTLHDPKQHTRGQSQSQLARVAYSLGQFVCAVDMTNYHCQDGVTALMLVCDEGNIEMVDLLLQYCADPNLQQPVSKIEVLYYTCSVCWKVFAWHNVCHIRPYLMLLIVCMLQPYIFETACIIFINHCQEFHCCCFSRFQFYIISKEQ